MQAWIAKLAAAMIPVLVTALEKFVERVASRIETAAAVKQAKAAKTAEELRAASKRITDATNRV